MNILVTGANGQLGSEIRNASAAIADRWIFTDRAELDITDAAAVERLIEAEAVDLVVNCAAYTDVERAEAEPEAAERLNAAAPGILAAAMQRRGGWLIQLSTDYVFGGNPAGTPLDEEQPAAPTGVYGATKLRGEEAILRSGCRAVILRTAWLYSAYGRNFVKTMLELTATRPQLQVVCDQTGTPTYAGDLARAICTIIGERRFEGRAGIYHYANEGACTWFDFAKRIAELAGHTGCEIRPCRSEEFPSQVRRPHYSVLDKTKFKQTFGLAIPDWEDALVRCLQQLNAL